MSADGTRDPTRRFSDRVADYVRYRPGYPRELLDSLVEATGIGPGSAVADLGSGTGISARLLLRSGCEVYSVEPDPAMRAAAEEALGGEPRFHGIDGSAEATGLPDRSVDLATAAQAFHWFDPDATRTELLRILRPRAGRPEAPQAALFWNSRSTDATPFLRGYEALLRRFGTDYAQVDHTRLDAAALAPFFPGGFERRTFPNQQVFDLAGLRGRLLSSSYAPGPGHFGHEPMLAELERLFENHQDAGRVRILYTTELYLGRVS